jgi:hypothetical protein
MLIWPIVPARATSSFECRDEHDWQFLCGGVDHNGPIEPNHVSVGILLNVDPTLHQIADLLPYWESERAEVGRNWLEGWRKFDVALLDPFKY